MSDPIYSTVASVSGDCFAVSNAAGDTFVGEFAAGVRVWADCRADGIRLGTVTAATHDAAVGRTLVTVALDAGAALTPNLAAVRHGNDIPESLCSHAANHAVGGRDALSPASAALAGLVRLASAVETQAGTNTDKAVTPAGLAAAAKGLVSTNTTIYVATTGSDTTGTGAVGTPFASIAKALSSIAGKLIASGVIVTIQVADGTYTIASTIIVDHPDADKIQILGNTSAETTVPITSIDTVAKTITVAGNFVSNADATKNIAVGDIIGLAGSTTSGLNGAYIVSAREYSGGNTILSCAAEAISSAIIGGGSIVIKPCNRVSLVFQSVGGVYLTKSLKIFSGFKLVESSPGTWDIGIRGFGQITTNLDKLVIASFPYPVQFEFSAQTYLHRSILKVATVGITVSYGGAVHIADNVSTIDSCATGIKASIFGRVRASATYTVMRGATTAYSPAIDTVGNGGALITSY